MNFYVPYAYDYIRGKEGAGTIARCDALLTLLKGVQRELYPDGTFVLTAGFTPASPCKATPEVPESLAQQMWNYLKSKMLEERYQKISFIACPLGWGTLAETKNAINIIKGVTSKNSNAVSIFVSSNPAHLIRIMLCWLVLAPAEWKVTFIPADHEFGGPKEWTKEFIKILYYIPKLWIIRLKSPK